MTTRLVWPSPTNETVSCSKNFNGTVSTRRQQVLKQKIARIRNSESSSSALPASTQVSLLSQCLLLSSSSWLALLFRRVPLFWSIIIQPILQSTQSIHQRTSKCGTHHCDQRTANSRLSRRRRPTTASSSSSSSPSSIVRRLVHNQHQPSGHCGQRQT